MEIIEAILEIELRAENVHRSIAKDWDRLPARIEAETAQVRERINMETEAAIAKLQEETAQSTATQLAEIEEESSHQLAALTAAFTEKQDELHDKFFKELTSWGS